MTVHFFHSPTCPDCLRLKERFLPGLLARHPEAAVAYHDLLTERGYRALLEAERRLGREIDKTPPLAIVGRSVLAGVEAIENGLEGEIDRQRGIPTPPSAKGRISVEERFRELGLLAVAAGGLADGINPCAFVTLAFLLSYLALVGRRGKVLLLAGSAFAAGVFLAYFLVGLGLLEILSRIRWFALAGRMLTLIAAGAAGVLGLLSLRDFLRARRGRAAEAKLQLSERLKRRIHGVIRDRVRGRFVAAPSFATGFFVALLEFPCTGQVYFPIVLVLRRIAPLRVQAVLYLLLYNLLFILPLLAVFGLAYWGLTSERLAAAVRRNLGWAKLLLAIVFFGLGTLLFVFAG